MIRAVIPSDVPEIAEFYVDIRQDTVPVIHTLAEVKEWLESTLLRRGTSFVWEENGLILAWVDFHGEWLDQLYCRRGSIGRGLGKALLDFAKEQSETVLRLYTFQVNTGARKFYAREGFVEVKLGDGLDNEEGKPDVLLEWRRALDRA